MGIRGGSGPALLRSRVLRAGLKTHVPSGFCLGSRAAPRATAPSSPILLAAAAGKAKRSSGNVRDADFPRRMGIWGGSAPLPPRSRVLRAVLKTHDPSGFCFGSRAAPRASAPSSPMAFPAAAGKAQRASGNQGVQVLLHIRVTLVDGKRSLCRTIEVQGAQGRVEDPCPIRVLLWLQGGSQGNSSCVSDTVDCSSIGRVQRSSGNERDATFST